MVLVDWALECSIVLVACEHVFSLCVDAKLIFDDLGHFLFVYIAAFADAL